MRIEIAKMLRAAVLASCVVTSACAGRTNTAERPRGDAKVLVYNIHAGKDAKGVDNLAGVAELVRSSGADIVLLQEVDNGTRRSGNVNQPAVLARSTGFHVAFGSALDYDGGKYGVAILSRWPILEDTLFHLHVDPPQLRAPNSHEPRGALRAIIASPVGKLAVINTHIDAQASDRWRKQEADSVVSLVAQARRLVPMVIAGGDMNSTPESAVQSNVRAAGLRDSWTECASGDGFTYPDDKPVKRIDYLYLTGSIRCASASVIETRVSDHRPLLIDIRLATGAAAPARRPVAVPGGTIDPRTPLSSAQREWVERTLASLTLRERVGQMIHVWVLGDYTNTHDPTFAEVLRWIRSDGIGGVTMSLGSPIEVAEKINAMQRAAKVPLMVAADLEPNLGRLEGGVFTHYLMDAGGATVFPNAMAIAATGRESDAFDVGKAIGREAKAIGILVNFAPTVDVNNNPSNPVINTRSFGEDPRRVAALASAFVKGSQEAGVVAAIKHFPGHGDTDVDSHSSLPTVTGNMARLDSVELVPFAAGIDAGRRHGDDRAHRAPRVVWRQCDSRHARAAHHHGAAARQAALQRPRDHRCDDDGRHREGVHDGAEQPARREVGRRRAAQAARSVEVRGRTRRGGGAGRDLARAHRFVGASHARAQGAHGRRAPADRAARQPARRRRCTGASRDGDGHRAARGDAAP